LNDAIIAPMSGASRALPPSIVVDSDRHVAAPEESRGAERELAGSEALYRFLVERQAEMVSLARADGELVFVNDAYAAFYGFAAEAMIGRNLYEFVPEAWRPAVARHLSRVLAAGDGAEDRNQGTRADGAKRWIAWNNRAVQSTWSDEILIHSVGRDIDDQVAAERRLEESEAKYRLIAENTSDFVFQLGRNLTLRYASPACRALLGREADALIGLEFADLVDEPDRARAALALASLVERSATHLSILCRMYRAEDKVVWAEINFSATFDANGRADGVVGSARDVSARKAAEDELAGANARLRTLAERDGLTGLFNRRALDDAMASQTASTTAWTGCAIVDVDHFKAYNDQFGHLAGDDCLRRIAIALTQCLRRNDFACRYGGEEFVALFGGGDARAPLLAAERLRAAVAALRLPNPQAPGGFVTVSAGLSTVADLRAGAPVAELIAAADSALYEAKRAGRDRVACAGPALRRRA